MVTNSTTLTKTQFFKRIPLLFAAIFTLLLFPSCLSTNQAKEESAIAPQETEARPKAVQRMEFEDGSPIVTADTVFKAKDSILLTFAGDLMAHKPNWSQGHYDLIYEDIAPLLKESSLAFANMETPVTDALPYDTYPEFNVHGEYVEAAINAGFNVFSLANNHTNDKLLQGIKATKAWFDAKREKTKDSSRPVYAAGLKESSGGALSYQVIEKDGWTVLFVAITEILNRPNYASYIDFINPTKRARAAFAEEIRILRENNPCDLFVVSVHCAEPEYVLSVASGQRDFYDMLLQSGADVVWVNHPHVSKGWEVITDSENIPRKMIFYSMGNTISAQRTSPNWANPGANRDYTGDGYMAQVRFLRENGKVRIVFVNPVLLTTYITPQGLFVIKQLNEHLIDSLRQNGQGRWATYLEARKNLMDKIQGKTLWQ